MRSSVALRIINNTIRLAEIKPFPSSNFGNTQKSLKNTGNILRQIEEAQQYLQLCETAQQKVN